MGVLYTLQLKSNGISVHKCISQSHRNVFQQKKPAHKSKNLKANKSHNFHNKQQKANIDLKSRNNVRQREIEIQTKYQKPFQIS
jgi:3-polyprenyl-4-hydroxybenzoate decarboxylase